MVAYFVSFLILGLSICWAEWTMGRYGGRLGFNSAPGILHAITRHPVGRYLGVLGVLIPVSIYMYYVYVEAWCLGYAVNFLAGNMRFESVEEAGAFWAGFIGLAENGTAFRWGISQVAPYLVFVFVLNFVLIYRGIAKGIEWFCKFAMPTLVILAVVVLLRVLTLGAPDPAQPELNVHNGLGFMWNPSKTVLQERIELPDGSEGWRDLRELVRPGVIEATRAEIADNPELRIERVSIWTQLGNPQLWLAAAGQIFFSLSVGFGVIITYASYLGPRDDIVLSGLAATSANEFCEVALGGLITIPAAFAFLGLAGVAGGTFALGFNILPMVFAAMPLGDFFGFLFFFLLFLAAVTSSLSMLQPGIAYLEEVMAIGRKRSAALLGLITALGCGFIVYFSEDLKAMDTIDFWVGTFLIFCLATVQVTLFGWVLGIDKGMREAARGAAFAIPRIYRPIIKYLCPLFLFTIFVMWTLEQVFGVNLTAGTREVPGYVKDLFGDEPNLVARLSVMLVVTLAAFLAILAARAPKYSEPIREPEDAP